MFECDGILALERMERAVLKVKERLLRATAALEVAQIPYAVMDRTPLRDLIGVGLVDLSWPEKYQPELAERMQYLLDTPDG